MRDQTDDQLLREYAAGNETAFHEIVVRHTDLVYSSALRQVMVPDLARDVAQSVFTDLAQKAADLTQPQRTDTSLAGWLYRSTRYAALNQLRHERRRQARERQAMELMNSDSDPATDWERVRPILDEAMADLSEEDREALLLRFFRSHDFRAIGTALGVSDDAAQKRVSRALDRLRTHLTSRGVTTAATALSAALSTHAVSGAPAGLATMLSSAALAHTTLATAAGATAAKAVTVSVFQKSFAAVLVAAGIGTAVYEARLVSPLREQARTLQEQRAAQNQQLEQLAQQREDAGSRWVALRQQNDQLRDDLAAINTLRGEIVGLRSESRELSDLKSAIAKKDAAESAARATNPPSFNWGFANAVPPPAKPGVTPPKPNHLLPVAKVIMARTNRLGQSFEQMPEKKIPELQYTTEADWIQVASSFDLETEGFARPAMEMLQHYSRQSFGQAFSAALRKFILAHDGELPASVSQLQPYLGATDEMLFDRYKLLHSGKLADVPQTAWKDLAVELAVETGRNKPPPLRIGLHGVTR